MREAELLKAVIAAWDGIATSATLLPGKMHEHVAHDDNVPTSATKWATVKVVEQALARQTNGGPIREHIITITVKNTTGDGLTANATLMDTIGTIPTVVNKALDNGGTLIDMWNHNSEGGQTDDQRRTKPVSEMAVAWRTQSRWPY